MSVQRLNLRSMVCSLVFLIVAVGYGRGQQTTTQSSTLSPVPLSHLYWHFLQYQHHLDEKSEELEKQGQSGDTVRSLMQSQLKMPDVQFASMHKASDRLSASMSEWNARVQHLRSLYIQSKPSKDIPLTPEQQQLHDQLKQMNDEREAILTEQMNSLDNELSTSDRAAFRDFLTKKIASKVVISSSLPLSSSSAGSIQVANPAAGGGK
jgi:small-conductance mechanosensitive channel